MVLLGTVFAMKKIVGVGLRLLHIVLLLNMSTAARLYIYETSCLTIFIIIIESLWSGLIAATIRVLVKMGNIIIVVLAVVVYYIRVILRPVESLIWSRCALFTRTIDVVELTHGGLCGVGLRCEAKSRSPPLHIH